MNEPRRVPFIRGFFWISEGFKLVVQSPFGWMKTLTLWFGFSVLCALLPAVGGTLFSLLLPILFAGLMVGCRTIAEGRSMMASHLFAGFQNKPSRLITVGGVNVLVEMVLTATMLYWGGQRMTEFETLSTDPTTNLEQLQALVPDLAPIFLTLFLVQVVLLMMGWFAPALLVFTDMSPWRALALSGKACLINVLPFLAYSIGMGSLLVLLLTTGFAVPVLGVLLTLMVAPTIAAAVYMSYTDIFTNTTDLQGNRWTRVE
jgi:hypothetical protein